MKTVLVTGANGFIGKHLVEALSHRADMSVLAYDIDSAPEELELALQTADVIYHLAGVNRPQSEDEYEAGNAGFTRELCTRLRTLGRAPAFVLSSSIQALLDNPYGRSKRHAEEIVAEYAVQTGAACTVFRLKNVFGKWCRPNYNSVVATFCHNVAHDLPITISDPARELELIHIDDVMLAFIQVLAASGISGETAYAAISPSFRITLGDLAARIQSFREIRSSLYLPDLSDPLTQRLYGTYLTYLDPEAFAYDLTQHCDPRGALAEFVKAPSAGQVFVSRTRPGITRGNHYHHTKNEKFLVLAGEAIIRLRRVDASEVIEIPVRGADFKVVDIIPGYTHSIENVGSEDLVTLFWASAPYDPGHPDTVPLPVQIQEAGG